MMSANPHSGIHEAQVAKTLYTTVPTPQKAQGGQMIVETTNSNGGDVMPTLTTEIAHQTGAHMGFSGGYLLEHRERPSVGDTCWSIGNGQVDDAMASLKECCQTLNCMHETQKIAIVNDENGHLNDTDSKPNRCGLDAQ